VTSKGPVRRRPSGWESVDYVDRNLGSTTASYVGKEREEEVDGGAMTARANYREVVPRPVGGEPAGDQSVDKHLGLGSVPMYPFGFVRK